MVKYKTARKALTESQRESVNACSIKRTKRARAKCRHARTCALGTDGAQPVFGIAFGKKVCKKRPRTHRGMFGHRG